MIDKNNVQHFSEVKDLILREVKVVRGEMDEDICILEEMEEKIRESRRNGHLKHFLCSVLSIDSEIFKQELDYLTKIITIKSKILSDYRCTHLYHVVQELIRAARSAGFYFFVNSDDLYLKIGSKYFGIARWEIEDFVLQEFFPAAKIDLKKQTIRGRDEVIVNLFAFSKRVTIEELNGK